MDFEEIEIGPSLDNLAEIAAPPGVPEIKFRVPSTPSLDSANIQKILQPYESIIVHIQELLLWKRPLQFGLLIFFAESFLFIVYYTDMGFFQFVLFILMIYFFICIIFLKYSYYVKKFFPPIKDRGNEDDPNRIYSLEELSSLISIFGSRLHTFFLGCKQKAEDPTIFGQIVWIIFLFCFFVILVIVKSFPILFLTVHSIIYLPGIIFHPLIYPTVLPWLQRLMRTIAPKIKDES